MGFLKWFIGSATALSEVQSEVLEPKVYKAEELKEIAYSTKAARQKKRLDDNLRWAKDAADRGHFYMSLDIDSNFLAEEVKFFEALGYTVREHIDTYNRGPAQMPPQYTLHWGP